MNPSLTFQPISTTLFYDYILVRGLGKPFEVVWHRDTLGCGRQWFRGTDAQWYRDIASGFGGLHRRTDSDITLFVVNAFNVWRRLEFELERIASHRQRPHRIAVPPEPAWGARYDLVNGWTEIQPMAHDIPLERTHAHTHRIRRRG